MIDLDRRGRGKRLAAIGLGFVCPMVSASHALACGASAGGAAGVSACSLEEHRAELRAHAVQEAPPARSFRLGASYAYTSTAIRFDDTRLDETRQAALATLDYRLDPRWTIELAAGSVFGGKLGGDPVAYDFSPGVLAAGGGSFRLLDAQGARPFVLLTGQLSFAAASTSQADRTAAPSLAYRALDLRVGAIAGWNLLQVLTPYALGRVFGGPVYWKGSEQTGTDTHHYQVGGGLLLALAGGLDLFAEGVPLGERGLSAGAGILF